MKFSQNDDNDVTNRFQHPQKNSKNVKKERECEI